MKKAIAYTSLIVTLCALLLCAVGCSFLGPQDKSFSKAGMTITLTDEFAEQDLVTQTAYYVSQEAIVTTLKEDGSTIGDSYTVKEYAELVCTANNLDNEGVTEKDGYAEFTYEKELNSKEYYYYARCFKRGTDYWLIQFACETKNTEKFTPIFAKWASTVTFEE